MTRTVPVTDPAELFANLRGRKFADYPSFEAAFVTAFNARILDLPQNYTWRDALAWALAHGRLVRTDGVITVS